MFVCLCHAVTDRDISQAMDDGVRTVPDLMNELKVATQCGGCLNEVMRMINEQQHDLSLDDGNSYTGVKIYQPQ